MIGPSSRVEALPGYPLAEIPSIKRRLIEAGVDVIDLGAGDNDTPPPAPVVEALREAVLDPAMSKYGFQQGLPEFRRATSRYLERRFGQRFDPVTETLPLIGSKEGIAHLPLAVADPGDVCIVPEPGYQAYLGGTILAGCEPFIAPLRAEQEFLLELEQVPESVLRRAAVAFINYPNNPTAAVATREYLERTVAVCRQYEILLAYDNAYCDLTFDGYVAPSIFEIPGAREVAVEFFSLSKTFSMTGWRLGWAAGRPELIAALTKVKSYVDTGPFLALQRAAVTALDRAEEFARPVRATLQERRDACVDSLVSAGFPVRPPAAAMYVWVPLPAGVASLPFSRRALEEEGVAVLGGAAFGPAGEGFFRIALTAGPERLREAVARLARALARTREESLATFP
ncbi:MAG TPA: aminotransferase class I/II-fold pyridoxal phosphate-dependent enzyme [Gemmatimonadales bacterium]|jgi:LL-diaminopimelate aminotransferase|nr:aminotransferase class I/II-fold pyridoxal phosphate-dependent enzyme [Gemmatimonadales bacterium]